MNNMTSFNQNVSSTWSGDFESPIKPPKNADVVIIGGGIIGVSDSLLFGKRGHQGMFM